MIGTGITTIGNYAFQLCKNLENVIIPSGIVTIGAGAFADCSGLKNAVIPEGVTILWMQSTNKRSISG